MFSGVLEIGEARHVQEEKAKDVVDNPSQVCLPATDVRTETADGVARKLIELASVGVSVDASMRLGRHLRTLVDVYGSQLSDDFSPHVLEQLSALEDMGANAFCSPPKVNAMVRCMHPSVRSFYCLPALLDSLFSSIAGCDMGSVECVCVKGCEGMRSGSATGDVATRRRNQVSAGFFVRIHICVREINGIVEHSILNPVFRSMFRLQYEHIERFHTLWRSLTNMVCNGQWASLAEMSRNEDTEISVKPFGSARSLTEDSVHTTEVLLTKSCLMSHAVAVVAQCAAHHYSVEQTLSLSQRMATFLLSSTTTPPPLTPSSSFTSNNPLMAPAERCSIDSAATSVQNPHAAIDIEEEANVNRSSVSYSVMHNTSEGTVQVQEAPTEMVVFMVLGVLLFFLASVVIFVEVVLIVIFRNVEEEEAGRRQQIQAIPLRSVLGVCIPACVLLVLSAVMLCKVVLTRCCPGSAPKGIVTELTMCTIVLYATAVVPLFYLEGDLFGELETPWSCFTQGCMLLYLPCWVCSALGLLSGKHSDFFAASHPQRHAHIVRSCGIYLASTVAKILYTALYKLGAGAQGYEVGVFTLMYFNVFFVVLVTGLVLLVVVSLLQPCITSTMHSKNDAGLYRFLILRYPESGPVLAEKTTPEDTPTRETTLLQSRNTKLYEYSSGAVDMKIGFVVEEKGPDAVCTKTSIEGIDNSMLYTTVGIFVCNTDFEVVHWNYRMWHWTGYLPEQAKGTQLSSLLSPASLVDIMKQSNNSHDITLPALTPSTVDFYRKCGIEDKVGEPTLPLEVYVTPGVPSAGGQSFLSEQSVLATHYIFYCTGISSSVSPHTSYPRVKSNGALGAVVFGSSLFFSWISNEILAHIERGSALPPLLANTKPREPCQGKDKILVRLRKVLSRVTEYAHGEAETFMFTTFRPLLTTATMGFKPVSGDSELIASVNCSMNAGVTMNVENGVPDKLLTSPGLFSQILNSLAADVIPHDVAQRVHISVRASSANVGVWREENDDADSAGALDMLLGATIMEETMENEILEARTIIISIYSLIPIGGAKGLDELLDEQGDSCNTTLKASHNSLVALHVAANKLGGYFLVENVTAGDHKGGSVVHWMLPCFDHTFVHAALGETGPSIPKGNHSISGGHVVPSAKPASTSVTAPPKYQEGNLHVLNPSNIKCLVIDENPSNVLLVSEALWKRDFNVAVKTNLNNVDPTSFNVIVVNLTENSVLLETIMEKFKASSTQILFASAYFDDEDTAMLQAEDWWNVSLPYNALSLDVILSDMESNLHKIEKNQQEIDDIRKAFDGNGGSCPWERGACVGKGSFGKVYEATNKLTGGKMACKIVPLSECDNHAAIFREVTVMASLSHPNIIHYFYCECGDDELRIFMELADGCLTQKVPQNGISPTQAAAYMKDIIMGLHYIHSKHLVHRDMKVANVLMHRGVCKLIDFGTAIENKSKKTDEGGGVIMDTSITGTPHYMAPEVLEGDPFDWRADIWAVGCMLMEMLTGKPPWQHVGSGSWVAVKYVCNAAKDPDTPLDFGPMDYHENALHFFNETLSLDPSKRLSTLALLDTPLLSKMNEDYIRKQSVISYACLKRKESQGTIRSKPNKAPRVKASTKTHDAAKQELLLDDDEDRRGTTFSGWGG